MAFDRTYRSIWLWSLAFFILAALTGVLYRLGMLVDLPGDLALSNIRHAHSHLMFFNWVTPLPMLLIASFVVRSAPEAIRAFRFWIYLVIGLGAASFPFFLFYGYQSVPIADAQLPFSVIFSGLVMVAWYGFIAVYLKYRSRSRPGLARIFYDAALLMLVISSLGAWGVAVFQFGEIENPLLSTALTHFFLTVFTHGWCVLSAFGMIYSLMDVGKIPFHESWLLGPIVIGVPLTFPFGISIDLLTNQLLITASFGALLVSVGLIANLWLMTRTMRENFTWWWLVVLNLLAAVILLLLAGGLFPFMLWIGEHGMRIFYLHVILLGFTSLCYFAIWHTRHLQASRSAFKFLTFSILFLLILLGLSSGLLPAGWHPAWFFELLTAASFLPAAAACWQWLVVWRHRPHQDTF